ncbi:hypothetical protein YpE1979001_2067 [Yersinia pestis biovar Antiqua str. E1979001]|nr:hypothetical protein YpE1979001_2067 [Yersinia pestis biovar Antiqua str. E1979001]
MRLALRTANNHAVIDVTDQQSPGTASHLHVCRFAGTVHIGRSPMDSDRMPSSRAAATSLPLAISQLH